MRSCAAVLFLSLTLPPTGSAAAPVAAGTGSPGPCAAGGLNAGAMINMDLIQEETAAAVQEYRKVSA